MISCTPHALVVFRESKNEARLDMAAGSVVQSVASKPVPDCENAVDGPSSERTVTSLKITAS